MAKVPLKGSERAAVPGARVLAPAEATERLEVSVILRRRGLGEMQSRVAALASGGRSRGVSLQACPCVTSRRGTTATSEPPRGEMRVPGSAARWAMPW